MSFGYTFYSYYKKQRRKTKMKKYKQFIQIMSLTLVLAPSYAFTLDKRTITDWTKVPGSLTPVTFSRMRALAMYSSNFASLLRSRLSSTTKSRITSALRKPIFIRRRSISFPQAGDDVEEMPAQLPVATNQYTSTRQHEHKPCSVPCFFTDGRNRVSPFVA